jgi:CxxC motif-containing protein
MINKKIICIVCPKGCEINASYDEIKKEILTLTGNQCKRGAEYATAECIAPMRTLTSTVRITGGGILPVRTNKPVPRELLFECMKVINRAEAPKGTKIGDVIIKNILGTGSDIIASANAG